MVSLFCQLLGVEDGGIQPSKPLAYAMCSRVSEEKILKVVQWIFHSLQYRPGKHRDVNCNGEILTDMPVFLRNDTLRNMFEEYRKHMQHAHPEDRAVSHSTFDKIVKSVSIKGSLNCGLSTFYVDHIDLVSEMQEMLQQVERLLGDAIPLCMKGLLDSAREYLDLSSLYLKY